MLHGRVAHARIAYVQAKRPDHPQDASQSMNDDVPTLASWLGSSPTAALLKSAADEKRLHVETGGALALAELLPQTTIDALIASDAVPEKNFYLGAKGAAISKTLYRHPNGALRGDVVHAFLKAGASLVIDNIGAHAPTIAAIARSIALALNGRVGVNAYLSYGPVSVFKPHYDLHDVLAVQISGAKRWRGYGRPTRNPAVAFGELQENIKIGAVLWEETLQPGDILYLARGEIHDAVPEKVPSVHLTFGIHRRSI